MLKFIKEYSNLILLILFVVFTFFNEQANNLELKKANELTNNLIRELGVANDEISVVSVRQLNTQKALEEALSSNGELINQLATMEVDINKLTAIIRSSGTLKPAQPPKVLTVAVDKPAPPHTFETEDGLVVAHLGVKNTTEGIEYTYTTHEFSFDTSVVISEDKASVDVLATSSADDSKAIRIYQDVTAITVPPEPHKVLSAQLSLGASVHMAANPDLMASFTLHWLHPNKVVDVLSPRINGSANTFAFGIDAVHYNIADPIPVIDNLWIGAGANITHRGEWGGNLSIGVKL